MIDSNLRHIIGVFIVGIPLIFGIPKLLQLGDKSPFGDEGYWSYFRLWIVIIVLITGVLFGLWGAIFIMYWAFK